MANVGGEERKGRRKEGKEGGQRKEGSWSYIRIKTLHIKQSKVITEQNTQFSDMSHL